MNAAQAWRYVDAWRGLAEALALQAVQTWACSNLQYSEQASAVGRALRRAWRAQVRHRMALSKWAELHRAERLAEEASR